MRAITLESHAPIEERPLTMVELPDPVPEPDEILIRVRACGICHTDLHIIEGEVGSDRICMNGAAARLASVGDRIIIAAYCFLEPDEIKDFKPTIIVM